jgi:peptidoglycan biosynthesis protein MviN/MurJ (putative lipid II flippase)
VVAALSVVNKGCGFLKEIVVATIFGLSGALDVYLVAYVVVGFPAGVLLNAATRHLLSQFQANTRVAGSTLRRHRWYLSASACFFRFG